MAKRCIYQFVALDTQIFLTVEVGDGYNQRIDLSVTGEDEPPTVYYKKMALNNRVVSTFNSVAEGNIAFCFTNTLDEGFVASPDYSRWVDIKVEVGAQAKDFEALAKAEKLGPLELEIRKLEAIVAEITEEMDYLKQREGQMRDTNESTNARVKWFSILSLFLLTSLGCWQVLYLQRFFKRKRLID
ncbi:emp24/gp25L/p24 family/GOLD-domain-containing protein [Gongronella butleri]|nr:emp24/gp25L/p24 family/GOLD-domain-containing protein [Gongronella butleri]